MYKYKKIFATNKPIIVDNYAIKNIKNFIISWRSGSDIEKSNIKMGFIRAFGKNKLFWKSKEELINIFLYVKSFFTFKKMSENYIWKKC